MRIAGALVLTAFAATGCKSSPADGSSASPSAAPPSASPSSVASDDRPGLPREVPEVRDAGAGRATAALRALLLAYGIPFEVDAIARECKVDKDGASIDDLEEVAQRYGLDATQTILPAEHVLGAGTRTLPAIAVLDGERGQRDFVLLWRAAAGTVTLMHPREGRVSRPYADVARRLHVIEMPVAADAVREAMRSEAFGAALSARIALLGVGRDAAAPWLSHAEGTSGFRGYAALDAVVRKLEGDPPRGGDAARTAIDAGFGCALDGRCATPSDAPAPRFWTARPGPKDDEGEVVVRGTVVVAVSGLVKR